MSKKQMDLYFLGLISISLLMLLTNIGMFIRMNQFQQQVLIALQPLHIPVGLRTGENAPNFHLDTLTSERISLQDYKGSTVLLIFSSITCPACQQFYPELQKFHQEYPDVNILMISDGSLEENKTMLQAHNFDFPILLWDEAVASSYQIPGTPYLFVVEDARSIIFSGFTNELYQVPGILIQEAK